MQMESQILLHNCCAGRRCNTALYRVSRVRIVFGVFSRCTALVVNYRTYSEESLVNNGRISTAPADLGTNRLVALHTLVSGYSVPKYAYLTCKYVVLCPRRSYYFLVINKLWCPVTV